MHESFVPCLQCPATGEPLRLEVDERRGERVMTGTLSSSAASYPIVNGVPRFVGTRPNYAESFGFQWQRWGRVQYESQNLGGPMAGHTRAMFERIVMQPPPQLSRGVFLEVGCGSGRFIEVIRQKGAAKVIGVDYSSAVDVAAASFTGDPDVLIVQADALRLPVRTGCVDGVYSIGVLHHTPDPRRGFREMVRAVRDDGWVALCVYGKGGFYDDPRIVAYRKLFRLLSPVFGRHAPFVYANLAGRFIYPLTKLPLVGPLLRMGFPMARLPEVRWRILDTFDAVTPTYQSTHESYEVYSWFRDEGLAQIEPSDWGFTAYHGRKPAACAGRRR